MSSKKCLTLSLCLLFALWVLPSATAYAEDNTSVMISFDEDAQRTDLISKETVPEYHFAQRGSIRFHLWNIHEAQDYLTYLHDGIRTAPTATLKSMVKVQEEFSVWILTFKSDGRNSPRVRELAVSFIPLTREGTGYAPGERVYLRLDELNKIVWEE